MFLLEMMDKKNYNYMEHSIQYSIFLLVKVSEVGSRYTEGGIKVYVVVEPDVPGGPS